MAEPEHAALVDALLREDGVAGAYLFGSLARGEGRSTSDVDVGVLLVSVPDRARRLRLMASLQSAVAPRRLDLVILNDAPVSLAYRVIREGIVLLEHDHGAMANHRERTVLRYLDLEPLRRELARGVRDRVLEGRFGR